MGPTREHTWDGGGFERDVKELSLLHRLSYVPSDLLKPFLWQGSLNREPTVSKARSCCSRDDDLRLIALLFLVRDLSSFTLELASNPSSSIRSKIITSISHGTRHQITPETPTSQPVQDLIDSLIKNVSETLEKPACLSLTEWDCRSEVVREYGGCHGV